MHASETVEAQGHLIDSGDLQAILTTIVEHGAELRDPALRRRPHQRRASRLTIRVTADTARPSTTCSKSCRPTAATSAARRMRSLRAADMDGAAPEDFYSTTNHRTEVRLDGQWVPVEQQRMDAAIVVADGTAPVVPQAARPAQGRSGRVRHARRARDARRAVARQAHVRLHEQRSVVGAPRRDRRGARGRL